MSSSFGDVDVVRDGRGCADRKGQLTNFFLENGNSHFERWLEEQNKDFHVLLADVMHNVARWI